MCKVDEWIVRTKNLVWEVTETFKQKKVSADRNLSVVEEGFRCASLNAAPREVAINKALSWESIGSGDGPG